MATLEQVDKLRERANVSFEDAREALDQSNGDLLDALIYLEKNGKVTAPRGGGYYSSDGGGAGGPGNGAGEDSGQGGGSSGTERAKSNGESFGNMLRRFGLFLAKIFNIGNTNFLVASKNDSVLFSCPVTAVVLLVIFLFWITIPLFILSLFFGFRYHFQGAEIGRDSVNNVMSGASDAAEDLKNSFKKN